MATYDQLKKQFQDIARGAGSTTGDVDERVLKDIIAGRNRSYSVSNDKIVRKPGEFAPREDVIYNPLGEGEYTPPKDERDVRRETLMGTDYRQQATAMVDPGFQRAINQLKSQVSASRSQLPRQLLARGQAVGGQRTLQEQTLDRELAYGTADIEAQRQSAIQQAMQGLRQQDVEAQRYAQEQAFREREFQAGQEQQAIQNQLAQRELQLREQGLTADQAYQQAQLELQQNTLAEDIRQFNVNQDYKYDVLAAQYGGGGTGGATGTSGTQVDVSPYTGILNSMYQNNPENVPAYINNLDAQGVDQAVTNQLRRMYGVTTTITPTTTTQGGRAGGALGIQDETTSGIISPYAPKQPEPPEPPEPVTYELDFQGTAEYLDPEIRTDELTSIQKLDYINSLVESGVINPSYVPGLLPRYKITMQEFQDYINQQ